MIPIMLRLADTHSEVNSITRLLNFYQLLKLDIKDKIELY